MFTCSQVLSLWSLIFKELFPDVFPLVCDLALGSSVVIAVNLYFMQILLLAQSYCHSVCWFPHMCNSCFGWNG